MKEEFNPADFVEAFVKRGSTSNHFDTPTPSEAKTEKLEANWSSLNQSVFTAVNEKKAPKPSSNEMMTAVLTKGVSELNRMIENGVDFGKVQNSNGMTLLHAAAASTNENALSIVKEVVSRMIVDVNDRSKVGEECGGDG